MFMPLRGRTEHRKDRRRILVNARTLASPIPIRARLRLGRCHSAACIPRLLAKFC